ncbi:caspase family protein [Paenibacillus macerans]|uniref:caspase family protein n=1 Tax=Paenibacillus macerans TaxID=44252 RepID=UPI00203A717D|nr:caspase family protein [Paenibacillus macerans]MCM3698600.1 caspase family protein [Paenibacillus macerans]
MGYKFLLVGVNEYISQEYTDMKSAENDVNEFGEFIEKYFEYDNLELVKGKEATLKRIDVELRSLFNKCEADDVLVLYWAGHGDYLRDNKGYLITYDSTSDLHLKNKVSMEWLSELINESKSKSIIVFIDCCYSGYLTRSNKIENEMSINGVGKIIITASRNGDKAYHDNYNGLFTKNLLVVLDEYINSQNYNEIDVTMLYSDIVKYLELEQPKQVPTLKANIEGRFILRVKSKNSFFRGGEHSYPVTNSWTDQKSVIEKLTLAFKRNDSLDQKHFMNKIKDYIEVELPAGNVERIYNGTEKSGESFYVEIDWLDWIHHSPLQPNNHFLLSCRSRDEVEKMSDNKSRIKIRVVLEENNDEPFIKQIYAYFEEKKYLLSGLLQSNEYMEINHKNHRGLRLALTENSLLSVDVSEDGGLKLFVSSLHALSESNCYIIPLDEKKLKEIIDIEFSYINSSWIFYVCTTGGNYFAYIFDIKTLELLELDRSSTEFRVYLLNNDKYLKFNKGIVELKIKNDSIQSYIFSKKLFSFKKLPSFVRHISENKVGVTIYNDFYEIEINQNSMTVTKKEEVSSVISLVNDNLLISKNYREFVLYDSNKKQSNTITISEEMEAMDFSIRNGVFLGTSHRLNTEDISCIKYFNLLNRGEDYLLRGNKKIIFIEFNESRTIVAAISQEGTILIWK